MSRRTRRQSNEPAIVDTNDGWDDDIRQPSTSNPPTVLFASPTRSSRPSMEMLSKVWSDESTMSILDNIIRQEKVDKVFVNLKSVVRAIRQATNVTVSTDALITHLAKRRSTLDNEQEPRSVKKEVKPVNTSRQWKTTESPAITSTDMGLDAEIYAEARSAISLLASGDWPVDKVQHMIRGLIDKAFEEGSATGRRENQATERANRDGLADEGDPTEQNDANDEIRDDNVGDVHDDDGGEVDVDGNYQSPAFLPKQENVEKIVVQSCENCMSQNTPAFGEPAKPKRRRAIPGYIFDFDNDDPAKRRPVLRDFGGMTQQQFAAMLYERVDEDDLRPLQAISSTVSDDFTQRYRCVRCQDVYRSRMRRGDCTCQGEKTRTGGHVGECPMRNQHGLKYLINVRYMTTTAVCGVHVAGCVGDTRTEVAVKTCARQHRFYVSRRRMDNETARTKILESIDDIAASHEMDVDVLITALKAQVERTRPSKRNALFNDLVETQDATDVPHKRRKNRNGHEDYSAIETTAEDEHGQPYVIYTTTADNVVGDDVDVTGEHDDQGEYQMMEENGEEQMGDVVVDYE